ncbi:MAG TPA: alpha/beta hydrolase [Terriglobales bacterium]|nr:alpha/beta hydrolase [Terriglobales bacterium]
MGRTISVQRVVCAAGLCAIWCAFSGAARAQTAKNAFVSRDATIDGGTIHYKTGGSGPAVILLHGFAETSRMWDPILPVLGEKFTVVAPDLPGIGDSSIPSGEIGMKMAAIEIHDLVRSLGITKARVVGHDIGLMVAYAYAAQFPSEVEKLVVMDAFLPGVAGWEPIYNSPNYWHFRFHGPTPEALVKGRESIYFAYFWNDLAADKDHSLPETDRQAYLAAYSRPGRMHAAWEYFASWPQTAKDFEEMSQTKLTMPVLSIGGDKSLGEALAAQMKLVATDVTVVIVKNSGHWILEEQPKQTTDALVNFL